MILIRGIKGEAYARRIKKGIVDCRDILSALLEPPVTGYEYSDYYEKNLVKALTYFYKKSQVDIHNPIFLYNLLIDYFIPHVYLTYFHILNVNSLEWLDKFDDDYQFIAVNVKIDRLTRTAIGKEYFGAKMIYVNSICELEQENYNEYRTACMCSIEDLFVDKLDMIVPLNIYNTLFFPLLCREQDEKFTDIENEFRIIAYDCPRIKKGIMKQISRKATITGKTGVKYSGFLESGINTIFRSNVGVLKNPDKLLSDVLIDEKGIVTLDSKFKPINISTISDDNKYIGNKKCCEKFINQMLRSKYQDIYVNQTVCRKYKIADLSDAIFLPGYSRIEY